MIVVDCCGGFNRRECSFLLTDPCVHFPQFPHLGTNNLGFRGIELFFKTHICNDCCRALKLPVVTHNDIVQSMFKSFTAESLVNGIVGKL